MRGLWLLLLTIPMAACGQPAAQVGESGSGSTSSNQPARTLVISVRSEASTAAAKTLLPATFNVTPYTLFNAGLARLDEHEVPRPFLVEALPQLNTETWRVLPDGRMETVYRLRANLTWHDGAPLTADDFLFAYQVYTTPELAVTDPVPQNLMEDLTTPDARTVVIRWRRPFPDAAALDARAFQSLPKHILEQPFRSAAATGNYDAFTSLPFWRAEYVGLGPYRIEQWEGGAFLQAAAFDRFVRGRPKIARIEVRPMSDPNTVLAGLLAGDLHIAIANSLPFQDSLNLKQEWAVRGGGGVVLKNAPSSSSPVRRTEAQLLPERVAPGSRALLDVRVRRALAHAVDKQTLNDGLFKSEAAMADTLVPSHVDFFPAVDGAVAKYPFDLRQADRLMNEAGYPKGPDGFYASPTEGRFTPEIGVISGTQNEAVRSTMAAGWKAAGFAFTEATLPAAQAQSGEARAMFGSLFTTDGGALPILGTPYIPSPDNRWNGNNRSNWSNPAYDRLVDEWNATLDRDQRNQRMVEMARIYSEELPSTPIYYNLGATAHTSALKGRMDLVEEIQEWEFGA